MKKEFMEPEMRRIELNLKERIATGSGTIQYGSVATGVTTQQFVTECAVYYVNTDIPVEDPFWDIVDHNQAFVSGGCADPREVQAVLNSLQ